MTVIIWIIFAALCGVVAYAKGRRVWLWVIWGILAGLFSLIIVACLPKIVKGKICPRCAETIKTEALICYHCGHDFTKALSHVHQ